MIEFLLFLVTPFFSDRKGHNRKNTLTVSQKKMGRNRVVAIARDEEVMADVKTAAPLLGSFADVWESRQTSEIVLDELKKDESPESPSDSITPRSALNHPLRVVRRNPYSVTSPIVDVYTCSCDDCRGYAGRNSASAPVESEQQAAEEFDVEPAAVDPAIDPSDLSVYVTPEQYTMFMPPPPPRCDTATILAYGGTQEAEKLVTQLMIRWYSKVTEVQAFFLAEEHYCPQPDAQYPFQLWCEDVNKWWTKMFSHCQRKPMQTHGGYW